jgi:hypothetical protein
MLIIVDRQRSNALEQGFPTWGTRLPRGTQEVVKEDKCLKKWIEIAIFAIKMAVLNVFYCENQ